MFVDTLEHAELSDALCFAVAPLVVKKHAAEVVGLEGEHIPTLHLKFASDPAMP